MNLTIYNNMDGSRRYYAKWSKSDRKGQKLYDLTHVEYKTKKEQTNEQNKNRLIDTDTEWWLPEGKGSGMGDKMGKSTIW